MKYRLALMLGRGSIRWGILPLTSISNGLKPNKVFRTGVHCFQEKNSVFNKSVLVSDHVVSSSNERCTIFPDLVVAPKISPLYQQYRIYADINHLTYQDEQGQTKHLTVSQRNIVVNQLMMANSLSFDQIRKALRFDASIRFSQEKSRTSLPGHQTNSLLKQSRCFGNEWMSFSLPLQNQIVLKLLYEQDRMALLQWLVQKTAISETKAQQIVNMKLSSHLCKFSMNALELLVGNLKKEVISCSEATKRVIKQINSHKVPTKDDLLISHHVSTNEHIQTQLNQSNILVHPRTKSHLEKQLKSQFCSHVFFGDLASYWENKKIILSELYAVSSPVGQLLLEQLRKLMMMLVSLYGLPTQIAVGFSPEIATKTSLALSSQEQQELLEKQKECRLIVAMHTGKDTEDVTSGEILKVRLWEELDENPDNRRCPYSGELISPGILLSKLVDIDHILPWAMTHDDSFANKTVVMKWTNQVKADKTPYDAFSSEQVGGVDYDAVLRRVQCFSSEKRYRFEKDAYAQWQKRRWEELWESIGGNMEFKKTLHAFLSLFCKQEVRVVEG